MRAAPRKGGAEGTLRSPRARKDATNATPKLALRTSLAHRPVCGATTESRCNGRDMLGPVFEAGQVRVLSVATPPMADPLAGVERDDELEREAKPSRP